MLNEIQNSNAASLSGLLKTGQGANFNACSMLKERAVCQAQIHNGCNLGGTAQSQDQLFQALNATLNFLGSMVDKLVSLFGSILSKQESAAAADPTEVPAATTDANGSSAPAAENTPVAPETTVKQNRQALKKSGDFLWKPSSEKDGKLVVLLPSRLTGKVKSVTVMSADGSKVLAKGKYSGVGNGDREHFRFSKAGAEFPANSIVQIKLKGGETRTVRIGNPQNRITR